MNRHNVLILFIILSILGCVNEDPYKDFILHPAGFKYKIWEIGNWEDEEHAKNILIVQYKIYQKDKSKIFEGVDTIDCKSNKWNMAMFNFLHKNDSIHILASQEIWLNTSLNVRQVSPDLSDLWLAHIKVLDRISGEALQARIKLENFTDEEWQRQKELQEFLKENNIGHEYYWKGMYVLPESKGKKTYRHGDTLDIFLEGYLLDGTCFDSLFKKKPFEYIVGTRGQLIKGLEEYILHEKNEQIVKIILPSQLAFHDREIVPGLVRPYENVIYRVKIKIK